MGFHAQKKSGGEKFQPDILKQLSRRREKKQPPVVASGAAREVSLEEIQDYIELQYYNAFRIALGTMLCICSPVVAILLDGLDMAGLVPSAPTQLFEGLTMIFLVAVAVCLYMYSAIRLGKWDFLKEERCHIDARTMDYIRMDQRTSRSLNLRMIVTGVIFLVLAPLPGKLFSLYNTDFAFIDNLSMALFLILLSIGAFLITMPVISYLTDRNLLRLNDHNPHLPRVYEEDGVKIHYKTWFIDRGMSVYWPTVICIYISYSFLSFRWAVSWIIFPLAWIISALITRIFRQKE